MKGRSKPMTRQIDIDKAFVVTIRDFSGIPSIGGEQEAV